jgi:hypothetical protein
LSSDETRVVAAAPSPLWLRRSPIFWRSGSP